MQLILQLTVFRWHLPSHAFLCKNPAHWAEWYTLQDWKQTSNHELQAAKRSGYSAALGNQLPSPHKPLSGTGIPMLFPYVLLFYWRYQSSCFVFILQVVASSQKYLQFTLGEDKQQIKQVSFTLHWEWLTNQSLAYVWQGCCVSNINVISKISELKFFFLDGVEVVSKATLAEFSTITLLLHAWKELF